MSDQVEIYNMALDAMGSQSTVSAPNEGSAEANALNRHWRAAIDEVLRAVHWNFARFQIFLTLLKDASAGDAVPQPWLYEYAYPPDCVLARYLMPSFMGAGVTASAGPAARFLISSDDDSGANPITVLLTNQAQAQLVYTRRITNPILFDAEFVEGLRRYLAHRITTALSGDKALSKTNYELAMIKINEARARNGNEGITVHDPVPEWIRARGYTDGEASYGASYFNAPQALTLIT